MVEMMSFKLKIFLLLTLLICVGYELSAQEVSPRIAGLEGNREYLSLLREDLRMQQREDSVIRRAEVVRRQFRDDPANRAAYGEEILRLEDEIFALRHAKGKLIDRINAIEQEWVLTRLDTPEEFDDTEPVAAPPQAGIRNLIANRPFRDHLPPADYAALEKAQEREREAVALVARFADNYAAMLDLQERYAATGEEREAQDLYERFHVLDGLSRAVSDSLAAVWSYIYDNKTFAYGFLLDKLRQDELLSREVDHLARTQRRIAQLEGRYASDALANYFLQKQALVRYELDLAETLGLAQAGDSLRAETAYLEGVEYRLPKTELKRRYFLDYEALGFASPAIYNARNPIPECRVYEHGNIYRILLGTFRTKQSVAIFKGAYPLCYLTEPDSRVSYYAGGFATREEADKARGQLLEKGFRRPEIVLWTDGAAENLTRMEAEGLAKSYRVEIAGTMTEAASEAIRAAAEGRELSRVGQDRFVVGLFDDRAAAERVAEAVAAADVGLEIKVSEIDG